MTKTFTRNINGGGAAVSSPATLHVDGSVTPQFEAVTRRNIFREPWAGSDVNSASWVVSTTGAGASYGVSGGTLTLVSGTVNGNEASVTTTDMFALPTRVLIALQISQRIANQEARIELFSVDPATGLDDGLNLCAWRFSGVTATAGFYEVQETGLTKFVSGSSTIATTASQSLYGIDAGSEDISFFSRALNVSTSDAFGYSVDGQIPDPNATYKLRIRMINTGTAASSTTLSCTMASVLEYHEGDTATRGSITGVQAIPVSIINTNVGTASQSVQGIAAANTAVASAGNPVVAAALATSTLPAVATTGRTTALTADLQGHVAVRPYSLHELQWQFACTAVIATTTAVAMKASAGAGVRNYVTGITYQNTNATATEVQVLDGAVVIWRGYAPANMAAPACITFPVPLKGTAATAVNFACATTAAAVYANAQGYSAGT
jgi:hypothetical protein